MESNLKEATKREAGGLYASVWRWMLLFMLLLLPGGRLWAQDGWKAQETNPQNYLYWVHGVGYDVDLNKHTAMVVESAKDLHGDVSLLSTLTITRWMDGAVMRPPISYAVESIDAGAFENRKITSVVLGVSVKSIKTKAFKGCRQLKKVIYVGASAPNVAAGAFDEAGVSGVEAAAGGVIVFTTPTGHGKLNATLNGKLIGSGTPAEKGELVVTATAAEHYMVASNSMRGGAYTTSEVGVTIDGRAVAVSEVELDRERRSVTVKLQLDGTVGKRVEVAFMPQMVKVDYGVLQSQARVFATTDNRSSELHYENGGTLTASVSSGKEVEYGAKVDYIADPGSGATLGSDKWAVESWRVGGEEVAGANGTSFSRLADGQQVQVRFKRTKFLIRYYSQGRRDNVWYGEDEISEKRPRWFKAETIRKFETNTQGIIEIGLSVNGVWFRGKAYTLIEDSFVDVYYRANADNPALVKVVRGPGRVSVVQQGSEVPQRGVLQRKYDTADVRAYPEDGAELRSLTIRGVSVPILNPSDGVKVKVNVPREESFRVFATFAEAGKQIVTITEEGLCSVTVLRDGRELRNGDEIKPGDRLEIKSTLIYKTHKGRTYELVSLTVNGAPFTSGDVYVVGSEDVNISSVASFYEEHKSKPSYLTYSVFGPGNVKFAGFDVYGNGAALVAGSTIYRNTFTPTATPDAGAQLVRLTANGKVIEDKMPFSDFKNGEDVYVEAVFAKSGAFVCLQKVTGSGYIKVLRHGERLRPGAAVEAGEQLTIVAKPSEKAGAMNELKLLTVNGVPWESGREYTVPDGQHVSVEAIFGSVDDHMVLLSQRGEGYVTLKKERGVSIDKFPYLLPNGENGPFEVNATPTYGWKLGSLYWGNQAIASGASGLLVGDDDITVFAHFVQEGSKEQHLYLPIVSGGKVVVTRDGKSLGSAATITAGEELTITAQPESDYRVAGPIYVNGEPFVGTQYKVPAVGNVEVKASFVKLDDVILSLVNVGDGVLQAEQDGKVVRHGGVIGTRGAGGKVKVEKNVVVSAKPGRGQQLVSLTVDGKTVNATESNGYFTYTIKAASINDDVTVRAVFGPQGAQVLTIDVEGNAGGSVKVYKEAQVGGKEYFNSGSVVSGATLSFEVKAAEGWKLTEFSVNGTTQDPSKTFQVGSENVRVRAKFEKVDYTLSVETLPADGSRGTVKVELAGSEVITGATIHIGDRLKVTIEPEPGNEVKGVSVTGAKQVGADEYEVLRDTEVAVTFGEKGKPVLFVDVQPNGAAGKVEVLDAAGAPVEVGTALTKGAQLKVTATPEEGYKLARLTLNGVGIHSPESITVGDEVKIVAYFEKETPGSRLGLYRLIEGGGKGTVKVTRNGEQVYDGAETLRAGDELSITATPDGGSRFVTLQVNGVEVSNPRDGYVVQGAVTVKAVFARDGEYAMSIAESGPGKVEVRRNGQILLGGEPVQTDDRLEITAVPYANAHTSSLTVDGQPFVSGQSVKVTNHDIRIEAAFAADSDPMILTLRSTGGGVLWVIRKDRELGQNEKLAKDDALTVVAKPDEGYRLDLLLVNGEQRTSGYVHTVAEGESVTAEARFAKNDTKTLQLLPGVGGMLVAKDRGTNAELVSNSELHEGQNIDIIATANPGNTIKEIKINGDSRPAEAAEKEKKTVEYTVTAADKTVIVEGSFEQKEYQLNAIALGGDGTGNVVVMRKGVELTSGSSKVRYGEELKIAVTPTDGKCEGVWVNDVRLAGESPYRYQVGTSDVTIRVLFVKDGSKKIRYTYEVRKEGGAEGSLTVTKNGETQPLAFDAELAGGDVLHIRAAAENGSYLSSLTVNDEAQDVKVTEVVWTVPTTVAGGAVNVVAEFLPVGKQKLEVLANGPGEVRVTSMNGLKLYQNGSLVSEDTPLLVTVNPNAGSICKLLTINGAAQELVNNQVSFKVVKEGAKIWAEFGSSAEYKLYYQNPVVGIITVTDVTRSSKLESGAVLTKGQKLRIEAAPRLVGSYALKELKVNGEAKASGVEIEVGDKDVLVEALFAKALSLTVTVNPTAVGRDKVVVKDAKTGQVLNGYVAEGQEIEVEANKTVRGYNKVGPRVEINGQPTTKHTVGSEDVEVEVTYTINRYTLEKNPIANAPAGASYSVVEKGKSDELSEVYHGQAIEVQVTQVNGYTHEVTVEGASKEQDGSYTVKGAVKVTVTYTPNRYTLTVKVEGNQNNGGATVKVGGMDLPLTEGVKGTAKVKYGDELTVEPVAVAGYNAVVSPASPITVADDVNVVVTYTVKEYTLTVSVKGGLSNGGATVTVGGAALTLTEVLTGTAKVNHGDVLTVVPIAVAGYNAVVSPASPITVAGDVNVVVTYTAGKSGWKAPVVEPAVLSGQGGVTVTDTQGNTLNVNGLKTGQKIKIEATAVPGYDQTAPTVAVLSGLAGPVDGVYTVKADEDVQVKVAYTPNKYTLEKNPIANAPAGTSYSVVEKGKSDELSEVYHGQAIEVQVTPVNGYTHEVTVEGADQEQDGSYTVTGAVKVTVTYTPKAYTLTVTVKGNPGNGGAKVTVGGAALTLSEGLTGTAKVNHGDELTVVPVAVAGYNAVVSPASPITVTGDVNVEVTYTAGKRGWKAPVVEPAVLSGQGGVTVTDDQGKKLDVNGLVTGQKIKIEATAVSGYNQTAPTVAVLSGLEDPVDGVYTVKADEDVQVKVAYTPNKYTLTVTVKDNPGNGGATVKVGSADLGLSKGLTGTVKVNHGDVLTVVPVAVAGYNAVVSPASPITVTGDVNVEVSYTAKEYTLAVSVKGNPGNGGAKVTVGGAALTLSEGLTGTAKVNHGDELTVEPVAVAGYNVEVSPASPITVTGDVNVEVSYTAGKSGWKAPVVEPAALSGQGGVTVTDEQGKVLDVNGLKTGQKIKIEATAVSGYDQTAPTVAVLSGLEGPVDGVYTVKADEDVQVKVTYTPNKYTLTVVKVGVRKEAGEVLIAGEPVANSVSVKYGVKVKVSAAAKQGEEKVTVEKMQIGDKVYYSGEEQEVTVTGDLTVTVNFGDVDRLTLATSVVPEGTGKVTVKAERNGGEVVLSEDDELVAGERLTISAEGQKVPDLQQPGKEVQYRLQVIKVNGAAYTSHDLPLPIKVTTKVVIEAQFLPENVSANEVRLVTSVKGSGKGKVEVKRKGEPKPLAEWSMLHKDDVLEVAATPEGTDELLSLNVSGEERQNGGEYIVTGVEPDGLVKVEATFVKAGKLGFSVVSGANGRVEVWRDGKRLAHGAELTKGEELTITAVPLPGYVCTRLEVDGMPFVGGDEYTVEHSFKVYAEFGEADKQLLVVDCGAHGSVTVMRGSDEVKSSGIVQQGDELTITATPASVDYELSVLTVNGEEKAPSPATYTVGTESRVEVKARFRTLKAGVKSVVILSSDGGRVEAQDADGTRYRDGDEVQVGVKLTVTAEASRGYRLEKLTVNAEESQAGSVEYTVADGDKEVLISAIFTRVPYKLELVKKGDAEADGEVAVKVNGKDVMAPYTGVSLYRGDAVEFVPSSANSDVECASVNVNGRAMRTQPYVYTVVDSDVKAVVVFTNKNVDPKPVYLYIDVPNGHGTLVIDGEATKDIKNGDAVNVAEEKALTLTAAPETGYKLDRLTVNGERVESGAKWQIPSGVEKIEVVAEFVQENAYRLTIAKFGNGEVTVASKENPTVTYSDGDWLREGQELVVIAKAEGTNKVKALTINGKLVEGAGAVVSGEYTVAKEDVKVQAAFGAANEYMLIVACGQEGKVVVTDADGNPIQPMAKLTEGQKLKVTAEATATGYGLKRLVVNGESVVSGSELEVKSDVVVMAEFARAYRLSIAVTPQELTEHVAVENAEGLALRDGDEVFLGDAISVNVEDVDGYKVESKVVDGANKEASGQWVVTGNVKVDVVYEKVLHEIVVELRDEAEQPVEGAAVLVAGYEVIEAGNGDYTVQLPDGSYKVTAKKEGYEDAELDVTVGGEDKKVTLTLRLKEKTAVESVLLSAVTLTPNPASVAIRLSNAEAAKSYAVYTLRGVEVMRGVLAGESMVAIDVTSLADGVYLLRVEAADGARVLRFVVAR